VPRVAKPQPKRIPVTTETTQVGLPAAS